MVSWVWILIGVIVGIISGVSTMCLVSVNKLKSYGADPRPTDETIEDAINALIMCKELMLFDPNTGEVRPLELENEDNQALYHACDTGIWALQRAKEEQDEN